MHRTLKKSLLAFVALLSILPAVRAAEPAPTKLEAASLGSTSPVHRFGAIWLAGQPGKADLALARELGIGAVVNLRKPGELDWDEGSAVRALGLAYVNPAFQAPDELTDEVFDAVRRELARAGERPLLLHCASANRVGAVWLALRVLDGNLSYDAALREAETVGLKNPALRDKARGYVERRRGAAPTPKVMPPS